MTQLAEGDLLTVEQARRLVPLGKSTIYALIASGQLPSYRVSPTGSRRARVLIARRDLEAYIDKCRDRRPCAPTQVDVDEILAGVRKRGSRA